MFRADKKQETDWEIRDDIGIYHSIRGGEQWLKMNFNILLEDGSRLQKTDSIWLPGRYYDINDRGFGEDAYPVYKFRY